MPQNMNIGSYVLEAPLNYTLSSHLKKQQTYHCQGSNELKHGGENATVAK